jgi:hypothetical protein
VSEAPRLILGPLLRYVSDREATLWVETDHPCEVEILGRSERTFTVLGHHYALVCIEGLEPGASYEYEVRLDGRRVWPEADSRFPPSRIRTLGGPRPLRLAFGSCRQALPHEPPFSQSKDQHELGAERDALYVLALQMANGEERDWPEALLMLGDQVYVDEGSPEVRSFIRSRRDTSRPPGEEVADFEEYTRLYWESWSDPPVRWLFSTVSTAMVIDDHDMSDDWNISRSWLEEMRTTPWWRERVLAGLMTYWLYQYLGNMAPHELAEDRLLAELREAEDGGDILRRFAIQADEDREGIRWSYHRDLGRTRLVVMDSRIGRVLEEGKRSILDDHEHGWLWEQVSGDFDHLLLATSDPFLLTPAFHHLEAWNEAVCDGAWGPRAAWVGERIRRALDLDHWPAFKHSFDRLADLLRAVGSGERGPPPASIVVLSGDVHHAYLADVAFPRGSGVRSHVYQAVCSPFRNPLEDHERRAIKLGLNPAVTLITRALARAAGVEDPPIRWRFSEGPFFDNQVATLGLAGREASLKLEKTIPGEAHERRLEQVFSRRLA